MNNALALYDAGVGAAMSEPMLPADLAACYEHIKSKVISCQQNREQLIERTKELYWELYCDANGDNDTYYGLIMPAVNMIADRIDSENIEAIALSCEEAGFGASDIDQITAIYCHEIGWTLDTYVKEILWSMGLTASDMDAPERHIRRLFKSKFHPDQIFFNFKEV